MGGSPRRYAVLSIVAAVLTIGLKLGAYFLTGSVGLFSDAAESVVNLVAAVAALWALLYASSAGRGARLRARQGRVLSSGLESALILIAVWIGITAWDRLMDPQPLHNGYRALHNLVAAAINGIVAPIILRAGRRLRSITLQADAQHLLTDVWTSLGVVLGIATVHVTGWLVLDPLIGLLVTANILWTGVRLLRDTAQGLLDRALPPEDRKVISRVLSATKRRASSSTPCARGPPGRAASSRCTCSCRASGRCNRGTTSRSRSRRTLPRRCPRARSSST